MSSKNKNILNNAPAASYVQPSKVNKEGIKMVSTAEIRIPSEEANRVLIMWPKIHIESIRKELNKLKVEAKAKKNKYCLSQLCFFISGISFTSLVSTIHSDKFNAANDIWICIAMVFSGCILGFLGYYFSPSFSDTDEIERILEDLPNTEETQNIIKK